MKTNYLKLTLFVFSLLLAFSCTVETETNTQELTPEQLQKIESTPQIVFSKNGLNPDATAILMRPRPPKRKEIKLSTPLPASSYATATDYFNALEIVELPNGNANWIVFTNDFAGDTTFQMMLTDANGDPLIVNNISFGQMWSTGENGYYLSDRLQRNTQYYLWIIKDQQLNLINVLVPISI